MHLEKKIAVARTETVDKHFEALHFGTLIADQDNNKDNSRLRNLDYYIVEELIKLVLEDPAIDDESTKSFKDAMKQFKNDHYIIEKFKTPCCHLLINFYFLFLTFIST